MELPPEYARLPQPLRTLTEQWARLLAARMQRWPPPLAKGSGSGGGGVVDYSGHILAAQALAHGCVCEDAVWIADRAGAIRALLPLVSVTDASSNGSNSNSNSNAVRSARAAAEGALTRLLLVLLAACPMGHNMVRQANIVDREMGNNPHRLLLQVGAAKARRLLHGLWGPLLVDLAAALPIKEEPPPTAQGDATKPAPSGPSSAAAADLEISTTQPSHLQEASQPPPPPDWTPSEERARAASLLVVALLADRNLGLEAAAGVPGVMPAVFICSGAPFTAWQARGAPASALTLC
jgi:hypothetical protein